MICTLWAYTSILILFPKRKLEEAICRNTLSILCFLCKLQIPLSLFVAVSLAAYICGIQVFATGVVMLLDKKQGTL